MGDRPGLVTVLSSQPQELPGDHACATGTFVPFPQEAIEHPLLDRFEQQAIRYPDRIAVKGKGATLTYAALNRAANRLAHAILIRRGCSKEPIGLLLQPGARLIVAILGALKAGKIYLPLDPRYPQARIADMLDDSHAGMIVTDDRHVSPTGALARQQYFVLNIDAIDARCPDENPGLAASPGALASICYTFSSTGQPKATLDTHRNLLSSVMRHTNVLRICPDDRMALLQDWSSGACGLNIFDALLNGAALYPFDLEQRGVASLGAWLIREAITIYHSAPAIFRGFLRGEEHFPTIRLIILESDQVAAGDRALCKKHFAPGCMLVNGWGETERGFIQRHLAIEERRGDRHLPAYCDRNPVPPASTIGRALAETLPDYVTSLSYMLLDTLPLSPTPEVDRPAFPVSD